MSRQKTTIRIMFMLYVLRNKWKMVAQWTTAYVRDLLQKINKTVSDSDDDNAALQLVFTVHTKIQWRMNDKTNK